MQGLAKKIQNIVAADSRLCNKRGVRFVGPGKPPNALPRQHPDASWSRPGSVHLKAALRFTASPIGRTLGRDHPSVRPCGPPPRLAVNDPPLWHTVAAKTLPRWDRPNRPKPAKRPDASRHRSVSTRELDRSATGLPRLHEAFAGSGSNRDRRNDPASLRHLHRFHSRAHRRDGAHDMWFLWLPPPPSHRRQADGDQKETTATLSRAGLECCRRWIGINVETWG